MAVRVFMRDGALVILRNGVRWRCDSKDRLWVYSDTDDADDVVATFGPGWQGVEEIQT
jgi:hypothetical protein